VSTNELQRCNTLPMGPFWVNAIVATVPGLICNQADQTIQTITPGTGKPLRGWQHLTCGKPAMKAAFTSSRSSSAFTAVSRGGGLPMSPNSLGGALNVSRNAIPGHFRDCFPDPSAASRATLDGMPTQQVTSHVLRGAKVQGSSAVVLHSAQGSLQHTV